MAVEEGWEPRLFATDLTPHLPEGLSAISYLLVPAPTERGCSARFDPSSPFFQTFFGVYVIAGVGNEPPDPSVFARIGNRDNRAWLTKMGDPDPRSQEHSSTLMRDGEGRTHMRAVVSVHADVGPGNPRTGLPPILVVPTYLWTNELQGYEDRADQLEATMWTEGRFLVAVWHTGNQMKDGAGGLRDTHRDHPEVVEGQRRMAQSVRVSDDGRGSVFSVPVQHPDVAENYVPGFTTDFGRSIWKEPARACEVVAPEEAREAWEEARRDGLPVVVRGAGHSCNGQTLTSGVVLKRFTEDLDLEVRDDGLVEVSCASSWYAVERELNRRGRAAPVLTDYLRLAVGGTLSVGGIGLGSVRHGTQLDQVKRARVLVGDGRALWCSREEEPELFRFALGGLGQLGILDRVVMETVPFHKYAHTWRVPHTSIDHLVETLASLEGSDAELYQGYIHGDLIRSEVGRTSSDRAGGVCPVGQSDDHACEEDMVFALHERRVRWLGGFEDHVRLWADYLFDLRGAAGFLQHLEEIRRREPFRSVLKAVYILAIREPSDPVRFAFGPRVQVPMTYGVGLYTMVRRMDPARIAATRRMLRDMLELCSDLGGRPYLYAVNDLDVDLCQRFYGNDYEVLDDMRCRYGVEDLNAEVFPRRS